jgi:hypothetical protein
VVEYNHNQEVQGDVIDLQEAASRSGALGTAESVKIQAGTTYPSRLLFFNPSPPSGIVKTEGGPPTGPNVELRNMLAKDSEIRQYLNGNTIGNLETKRFVYEPNYNEYRNSPNTTLEYGVLYNQYDNGENVIINEGSVVRGNQITLTFLGGDLTKGQSGSVSLEALPASAPARTVSVKPDDPTSAVEIKLPTRLSADTWENEILDDQLQSAGGNVIEVVDAGPNQDAVILRLEGGQITYDIRMAVVGIGPDSPDPDSEYMISRDGPLVTTGQSTSALVTLEVRDKYNNPVADEDIELDLDGQGSLAQTTVTTNRQGQATVQYQPAGGAPNPPYTATIQASYQTNPRTSSPRPFDASLKEDVAVDVEVRGRPTGIKPSVDEFVLNDNDNTTCVNTKSIPFLGDEAAQLNITWDASISGGNNLSSARIEMVDKQNGQLATSTRYSLNSSSAGDTLNIRDDRPNDDSCNKDYEVTIYVESDGGRTTPASLTAESGSDYPEEPAPTGQGPPTGTPPGP